MQYVILAIEAPDDFSARQDPDRVGEYLSAWSTYVEAIRSSGKMVSGAGLEGPATATTLRVRNGARTVVDGPYADSKEQLGGFFIVDVDHLDEALELAAACPAANSGSVEVRPLLPPMPGELSQ